MNILIVNCSPVRNGATAEIVNLVKGYTIALRTGPSMPECERIISSIEHFHGHLEIESCGKLGLCKIEYKENVADRIDEIKEFCELIKDVE